MKKVEIYSTPTCTYCNHAKAFFKEKGIEYTEYNVAADASKRQEMVDKTGQLGVPVIIIGMHDPIIGFDQEEIEAVLAA